MTPGIYTDLSGEAYAQEKDWVSAGRLKKWLPEHYRSTTPTDRTNLDFGIAFHTTILGAGEPVVPVVASSWRGKEAQTERESVYLSGGVPILSGELSRLDAMRDAVQAHSEAHRLLYKQAGAPEVSVFAEVDGVPSKARFDRLLDGVGVDLKTTTAKPGEHSLMRAVIDWGYDLQAAHYLSTARAAGIDLDTFVFVFVGKDEPHHVTVAYLDDAFLERGQALRDLALSRYLHPQMVPAYPGQDEPVTLTLPRWAEL